MNRGHRHVWPAIALALLCSCSADLSVKANEHKAVAPSGPAELPNQNAILPDAADISPADVAQPLNVKNFPSAAQDNLWEITSGDLAGLELLIPKGSFVPPLRVEVVNGTSLSIHGNQELTAGLQVRLPSSMLDEGDLADGLYPEYSAEANQAPVVIPRADTKPGGRLNVPGFGQISLKHIPIAEPFALLTPSKLIQATTTSIDWGPSSTATTFEVRQASSAACLPPYPEVHVLSGTHLDVAGLSEGSHYVCVFARWFDWLDYPATNNGSTITVDMTPPVIASLSLVETTAESVKVAWTHGSSTTDLKKYRAFISQTNPLVTVSDLESSGGELTVAPTAETLTVPALALGGSYVLNVLAEDEAGNKSVGTPLAFTVIPSNLMDLTGSLQPSAVGSTAPYYMATIAGNAFIAVTTSLGKELWVTDGTAAGTRLVKDINPGTGSSDPGYFGTLGGILYFSADDGVHGAEIWRSDGTEAGTYLLKDLEVGAAASSPHYFVPVGSVGVFAATTTATGYELWVTDGSEAGTTLVKDICPGVCSGVSYPTVEPLKNFVINGKFLFLANDPTSGSELWSTDGTTAGTSLVKDIYPGASSSGSYWYLFHRMNDKLYFEATSTDGSELWVTDGTNAGTTLVKDIYPGSTGSYPAYLRPVGNSEFVFRATNAAEGTELWKSDGSALGTVLVKDIEPGAASSYPDWIDSSNGIAYFGATTTAEGKELWRSDGTPAGTYLIKDISPGPTSANTQLMAPFGNKVVFMATTPDQGQELWISDGTSGGTQILKDVASGAASGSGFPMCVLGGELLFYASDNFNGTEIWHSDGTASGTKILKDLYTGEPRSQSIAFKDGKAVMAAKDASGDVELWSISNTGSELLKDIEPGAISSAPSLLVNANGTILFFASTTIEGTEIWKSNGTTAGTQLVKDTAPGTASTRSTALLPFNGGVFFAGQNALGLEPWFSDGTDAGTALFLDAAVGAGSSTIQMTGASIANGANSKFVFAAGPVTWSQQELFVGDGTAAGTSMVSLSGSATKSRPKNFVTVGQNVYFQAYNVATGVELFKTDGTVAGSVLVKDTVPGVANGSPVPLTGCGGILYFQVTNGSSVAVWKSDGTDAGTSPLLTSSGDPVRQIKPFECLDDELFFVAGGAQGVELWHSDGTDAGTSLFKDLRPGPASSNPGSLIVIDGKLYFSAVDATGTDSLWISDGTLAGTVKVPGTAGSLPQVLGQVDDAVIVSLEVAGTRVMRHLRVK